jgi:ribosomal protein S18 acetylase RimI-like enzyme
MKFDILVDRILKESNVIKLRGNNPSPKVDEYKNIVYSWGKLNPMNESEVLIDNCLLILKNSFNKIHIEHIRSLPEFRNQGHASKLLKRLVDLADKMNIKMTLFTDQTDQEGLPEHSLIDWYKRYGFEYEDEEGELMIRYPR